MSFVSECSEFVTKLTVGVELRNPNATARALSILRDATNFEWYIVPLAMMAISAYVRAISAGKWRNVAAGLALYAVHWAYEIGNGLVQHYLGHALWTVPQGTAYLILVGVGAELSIMFSVAGLELSRVLQDASPLTQPATGKSRRATRVLWAVFFAGLYALAEIPLSKTPAFVWVFPWWGAFPVFATVYVPFFLAAFFCYDMSTKGQIAFITTIAVADVVAFVYFGLFLHWI